MLLLDLEEGLLPRPVVDDFVEVVVQSLVAVLLLVGDAGACLDLDQLAALFLKEEAGVPEIVRNSTLQHFVAFAGFHLLYEHREEGQHLFVVDLLQPSREDQLCEKNGIHRADDSGDFALEQHVLLLVNHLVLLQDLVLRVEVSLLLVGLGVDEVCTLLDLAGEFLKSLALSQEVGELR